MDDQNLSGGVAPEGGESGSSENPWGAWEQAGVDSSMNPYEVRQYVDWVQDLTGPETHERALEQAMHQWGHLDEGESLADLMAIRDHLRAEREDPFNQYAQQEEQDPRYEADDDYQGRYEEQQAQSNFVDPNQLREVWQQDMAQYMNQQRQQMAEELEAERIVDDLNRQLDKLGESQGLEARDKELVWNIAVQQIQNQDLEPDDLAGIMDRTWSELNDLYARKFAEAAKKTSSAPSTTHSPSGAPADSQPKQGGLEAAMKRMADSLGVDPE